VKQPLTIYAPVPICPLRCELSGQTLLCTTTAEVSQPDYPVRMSDLVWVSAKATELLALHGLAGSWHFDWDRATTRLGQCDHRRKRITVSKHLTQKATDDDVEQVLLHEIAHALAGVSEGHGAKWRSLSQAIGYRGGRTHHLAPAHELAKWRGQCPAGHEVIRFRRPATTTSCAKCNPIFDRNHIIVWSQRPTYSETATSFQKHT
jgi:predicted SprT family Zn-dependent metalloprotease